MTKLSLRRKEYFMHKYLEHFLRHLYDCYNEPSEIKKTLWQNLIRGGYNRYVSIISYNKVYFTVGYIDRLYETFVVETANSIYEVCSLRDLIAFAKVPGNCSNSRAIELLEALHG